MHIGRITGAVMSVLHFAVFQTTKATFCVVRVSSILSDASGLEHEVAKLIIMVINNV